MTHPAVDDLRQRLRLGRERGAGLLSADEQVLLDRVEALEGPAALLLARLAGRVGRVWRVPDLAAAGVDDLPAALGELAAHGLVDDRVPWSERAASARVSVLAAGCRSLGLPSAGTRSALVARLAGREGWDAAPWVRLVVAPLLARVERWATLRVEPDRSAAVLERLGRRRYVEHPVTASGLVASRRAWALWEAVADAPVLTPEAALGALAWGPWPPGGLDLRRALRRRVREAAAVREREGDLAGAADLWSALDRLDGLRPQDEVRRARVRERAGDAEAALAGLLAALEATAGPGRLALLRSARRLARGRGRAVPPDPPLRPAAPRTLRLDRDGRLGARPAYGGATVEAAVTARVEAAGRVVLAGERAPWDTMFALLLADAMFLPVPGQLPVPRLAGPLDAGTPAFAARRPGAVAELLDGLAAGEAAPRLAGAWARHGGRVIAGVDPAREGVDDLVALAGAVGPAVLRAVLVPLLRDGWRALSGLPDLVVLPGPAARVEGLHPATLPDGAVLVEVKGEADTLRDEQRAWHDALVGAGARVELWRVVGGPGG